MRGWSSALGALLLTLLARDALAVVRVDTTSLTMRDDVTAPIDPGKRTLRFKSSTKRSPTDDKIVVPTPGGPADPRTIGAMLVVEGIGGTGDRAQLVLPASGWTLIGTVAKPKGYKFDDRTRGAPVGKLVLKRDLITIRGGGAGFGYTLDEPQQIAVGVRLSFGETEWCAGAPAKSARDDVPGKFTAKPKTPPPATCLTGAPRFALTVGNGYGSGTYAAGSTVHVWAAVRPQDQLVTDWTGDAPLLSDPSEWHSTLVMPWRDAAVSATIVDRPVTLTVSTFTGSTARTKTVRTFVPPNPRGLVLFLHGTGGNDRFITTTEAFYVALRAIESGYGVLGTEAEEAVAGDLDGDGKERWDPGLTAANVDFANLNALIASLRTAGTIGADTPLFAIGMSNGGSMAVSLGAVGTAAIAPLFPELRFGAVVSHCASARANPVNITTTPSAWLLCADDDNDEVDNAQALANSATLASHGVPTVADLHQPSPLYDERFARDTGVTLASSQSLAAELRAAGFVGAGDFFVTPTNDIVAAVTADPSLLPTLIALPPAVRADVVDQVRTMQAEHQMYSDWAAREIAFLDAHNP